MEEFLKIKDFPWLHIFFPYGNAMLNMHENNYNKAINLFEELFIQMNTEIRERRLREGNVGDAVNMTEKEKRVSFLNNYFVFKKVRDVDTEADYKTNMLFDDISDNFTGIGKTYSLTVGGANTSSGIGLGNGVLFINSVSKADCFGL